MIETIVSVDLPIDEKLIIQKNAFSPRNYRETKNVYRLLPGFMAMNWTDNIFVMK